MKEIIGRRKEIVLGENRDGSTSTLPPHVVLEGDIWVHPDRLLKYQQDRKQLEAQEVVDKINKELFG